MEQKIRVGAVSYLNTKPMINGLENWEDIELILDYPSKIAETLIAGNIDIGLVPIAVVPKLENPQFVTNYGIGCTGNVLTVALFSQAPLHEIETIYLDYQSKTSVALVQVLCKEYWGISPKFKAALPGYENQTDTKTAVVIIGDRAFECLDQFKYVYDLGEAWFKFTQLPFVFARWVATKPLSEQFIISFEEKIKYNLKHYAETATFAALTPIKQNYLTSVINYKLTAQHNQGLDLFLSKFSGI